MSGGFSSSSNGSFDVDDLLEIRARCKELTKEKEMLRDSKSQSFELIRKLEFHVKTLSEAHEEDKKRIQELERELSNCCQEIDYLQDQLNTRNSDINSLGEEICNLQLKLANMENLEDEAGRLREQMNISESECLLLMQEIEDKEVVIKNSASCLEMLEESISSMGLEYQCEIESTKLELIALDKENKDLKENVETSDMNAKAFVKKVEEQLNEWLWKNGDQSLSELEKEMSTCGNILGPLLSKFSSPVASDADLRNEMAGMFHQIEEYELLVKQLKEELRKERLKSKEEAEDLAQEMAELRYQITGLLEEECKRRACIEQISLQRIAELEAQIAKEQQKSFTQQSLIVRSRSET